MHLKLRHAGWVFLVFLFFSGTAMAADYIVSGASVTDANGLYEENGTYDGVPRYTKGIWAMQLEELMGPTWVIRNTPYDPNDQFAGVIYANFNSFDELLPPDNGDWVRWQGDAEPGLRITEAESRNIPSLSTWGILIMITLLSVIAIAIIRKNHFPDTGARA